MRVWGVLLSLAMAMALTPAMAFADDPKYDASVVATIKDDTSDVKTFTSLKSAVDVADGKTIVLQKNCDEIVEVKKSITFAIDPGSHEFTGKITVPEGFTISTRANGGRTTYIISSPIAGENTGVVSLSGREAPQTSVEVSKTAFPNGSSWAVLASDADFADAMSATGLAGTLDCPVLTTDPTFLSYEVLDEIYRLGCSKVYIIGGRGALDPAIETELKKISVDSERVYGHDSWDTSVKCASKIAEHKGNPDSAAIISTSKNFQDALSMSSFAYKYEVPIFLTNSIGALPVDATAAVKALTGKVYVTGGRAAVPETSAETLFNARVLRIAGVTGYDTSNQIATKMAELGFLNGDTVCVACGSVALKGLDALSGAALAGRCSAPVLLVNGEGNSEPADIRTLKGGDSNGTPAFLANNANKITRVFVLGGLKAVPIDVRNTIKEILGN